MDHHTFGYWMWFLFIGGVIGWVAGLITRGRGFGIPGDIVIGIVGAMLGGWMADILGISISSSLGHVSDGGRRCGGSSGPDPFYRKTGADLKAARSLGDRWIAKALRVCSCMERV